ncbi:RNA recognition motif-containing protein 2 [Elsinoe australis]|uniref:RNA recognition motif-containing protein 2 n=1 Tax=Elsinoe australis TaxID=40998 RepID=A0A4U7AU51_9PEZI|nr:RNA recognition motif-containing protein 2 [Elsinoe australis]
MVDVTSKKRKGAPEVTEAKKRKVTPTKAPQPKVEAKVEVAKPNTRSKTTATVKAAEAPASAPKSKLAAKSAPKKKTTTKSAPVQPAAATDAFDGFSSDDEEATAVAPKITDQTALLAGFSSDESDNEELPPAITQLPSLPDSADLQKQLKKAEADPDSTPGTIYIGRIPHGFYEPQMKAYFSQFGTVSRLRLSRNKLTGRPKHYGFIEFESGAVADIAAKTMDKYLMFGHILQVRRLRDEEVHPELWKGAGRRFNPMPRNKLERGLLERGTGRKGWEKRVKKEEKRRKSKADKLKEMGYEFEMPELRKVDSVPVKEVPVEKITVGEDEAAEAVEDVPVVETVTEVVEEVPAVEQAAETVEENDEAGTKRKKGRKERKVTKKARLST